MTPPLQHYNDNQTSDNKAICDLLLKEINRNLPDAQSKIWHAHPVWFIDGNPIVGYSVLKHAVRLLFWSGQSFDEPDLKPEGTFKAAEARYTSVDQVNTEALARWIAKSRDVQWNYRDIVRKKGQLDRIS